MNSKAIALSAAGLMILAFAGTGLMAEDREDVDAEVRQVVKQVEGWPLWQHAELTTALRRSLDHRLLTPKRKWLAKYSDLAGDAGVARIIHRGRYDKETWVRSGGAYFSFTSKTNDYNQGPDVSLSGMEFSSGFYGGSFGHVVELAGSDLRTVRTDAVPEWMRESAEDLFKERRRRTTAKARVGSIYAVRAVREDSADTLAVLKVLEMDEDGATFAWRVLERYPVWSRR